MSDKSAIEWTRGDDGVAGATWNPTRGCTKVSPGCKHCYAETFSERFRGVPGHAYELGFAPRLAPDKLATPLTWKKPRRIFVNSMSDLFHEAFSNEYIAAVFGVMAACPQHTFQVLTKRARRMAEWFKWMSGPDGADICQETCRQLDAIGFERGCGSAFDPSEWPLPNVWIGVSVEDQQRADERIPDLLRVPAAVRFLSCEPLLGRVDLSRWRPRATCPACGDCAIDEDGCCVRCGADADLVHGPDWVICGGESGRLARPMHPAWARSLRDQCAVAGVPFFFKQWGAWQEVSYDAENPPGDVARERYLNLAGGHGFHGEHVVRVRSSHKRLTGRLLDGVEHSAFPAVRP